MGRKSSSKGHASAAPPAPPAKSKGMNPLVPAVVILAVIGIGVFAYMSSSDTTAQDAAGAASSTGQPQTPINPEAQARAEALAKLGPREQDALPPIPFQGYAPPRSTAVVTSAYRFAAEHPEILSYVPCFCGCERSGHGANHDCFVRRRAANGDVVEWDEHGVECAVCIDVANRSRQMHASGASVRDIRAAIDKEFGSQVPTKMPTPHPPAAGGAHGAH
jgi:hypothetical protein